MENNRSRVRTADPFLLQYQPSELRIASEFLATWKPYLCRDLCHHCNETLTARIRSLDAEFDNGKLESLNLDDDEACSENINDTFDTNSLGSWKDAAEISSLASGMDGANRCSEDNPVASTAVGLASGSPTPRISWADMAQEDELEEAEESEEQNELDESMVDINVSSRESRISEVIAKDQLSREQREYIRFMNVKREKDFICLEKIKGKIYNILRGLELHEGVFSSAEQKRIVDYVYVLQERGKKGELKELTYAAPQKWMKGKGRVTIQFGCCYNYVKDKNGNPPGILQDASVDPLPHLFKVMIRRLVRWHVLPPTCVPDSCIVNIYEEGDCIPPHIDNHDFVRPFCTVSFLSECNIVFGSNIKGVGAGEFTGSIAIPLPVGSVLVLNGNAADVAKHCVPAVPTKRMSITFRRMDESKRPIGFAPEPDLQGIEPLSYNMEKTLSLNCSTSDSHMTRQPRRGGTAKGREHAERSHVRSEPRYLSHSRRRPANKQRVRLGLGN